MNPEFSILFASYGRPHKAISAIDRWFDRAARPRYVQLILALNADDPTFKDYMNALSGKIARGGEVRILSGFFPGSAAAWDRAAEHSTGLVLIQGQDDVEPPEKWDDEIAARIGDPMWSESTFLAVGDGFRKDKLCCTAIMNRPRYIQCGEFLHAGYTSVYSDDDVTVRAYADAAAGKCNLIEARDLIFLHRHHYHDRSVPMDATYQRENSTTAYAIGQALFNQRNRDILKFKTW